MTNVFDGPPDGRQSDDIHHAVSRFRLTYRALTPEQKALHDDIKTAALLLERRFADVERRRQVDGLEPQPRYAALAITALEEAVMWAVKGLTA